MRDSSTRRFFLKSIPAAGAGLSVLGAWPVAQGRQDETPLSPAAVRFRPEIEPIVRWMETTPRDRIVSKALAEIKNGMSYRDLMAGVFLAAIRNIKPRPVGFKFHAVMAVHSAHLLGQAAPESQRLLPLIWALDNFKGSQEQDVKEGDWTLSKVDETVLPKPAGARAAFVEAMEAWDNDKADAATAALVRSTGAAETMELFFRAGVRDQRNIGHKPIFSMQCWRTLQTIGWEHAEPVLRSLAFGLLDRQGDSAAEAAGPYRENLESAKRVREGWTVGNRDVGATLALLDTLRSADAAGAGRAVVEQLNREVAPESLWDAVMLAASELLMREPGIVALHAMTAANALHFIYTASGDDGTRKLALLQAAGWMPMYRGRITANPALKIEALEPSEPSANVGELFETIDEDRAGAAAKLLGYARAGGSLAPVFETARSMIFLKGRDSHQYKYGGALWEECTLASDPKWRAPLAAAGMYYVPGSGASDVPFIAQAREELARG